MTGRVVDFGRSGLAVSPLGLGTSHLASLSNPRHPKEMARLLDEAYELGVRVFDTADIYGQGDAERRLAQVARRPGTVICTKAGLGLSRSQTLIRLAKPVLRPILARRRGLRAQSAELRRRAEWHDLNPEGLRRRLTASLRRLGLDHVDIFLLHSPPLGALADGRLYDLLDEVRAAGLARLTGVSARSKCRCQRPACRTQSASCTRPLRSVSVSWLAKS